MSKEKIKLKKAVIIGSLLSLLFLIPKENIAAIKTSAVSVYGTVEQISDDVITLRTRRGGRAKIPMKALSLKDRQYLKLGQEVKATLPLNTLMQLNQAKR